MGLKNTTVGSDGMLFIAVLNHDPVGRHEYIGGIVLNVRDLIGSTRKKIRQKRFKKKEALDESNSFEMRLNKDGKDSGNIKFKVEVRQKRGTDEGVVGIHSESAAGLDGDLNKATLDFRREFKSLISTSIEEDFFDGGESSTFFVGNSTSATPGHKSKPLV